MRLWTEWPWSSAKPLYRFLSFSFLLLMYAISGSLQIQARDLVWGVNGHPFTAYSGIPFGQQLDISKELGVSAYRVNVSSTDQIDYLLDLVALAERRGITILPVLTPGLDLPGSTPEALYARAFNYAFAIASALRRFVSVIELGNEEEVYAILQPCETQDDGKIYSCSNGPASGVGRLEYHGGRWKKVSAVLKGLSDGVIAVDPKIQKAIGTAGWGHVGAFNRMEEDGISWDISVWHAYQDDPDWILDRIAAFKRPIWITELNHPKGSKNGVAAQASGLTSLLEKLLPRLARHNIRGIFIYELFDEPYWAPSFEASMGLVTLRASKLGTGWEVGEKKPAFAAVRETISKSNTPLTRSCQLDVFGRSASKADPALVNYAYCLVLGRLPDSATLAAWTEKLTQGSSVQTLIMELCESDEFLHKFSKYLGTNKDFLHLAYDRILIRKPDGGGFEAFMTQLSRGGMRRRDVILGMVKSSEFAEVHSRMLESAPAAAGTR